MVAVAGVPFPLELSEQWEWTIGEHGVSAVAKPHSDVFIDPSGDGSVAPSNLSAVRLMGQAPDGDFIFSARVEVGFASTFDAGVLMLWLNEKNWAKLCFEYSPQGQPMVVSVVARDVADDANGMLISDNHVWLRIARKGAIWTFHSSTDGVSWSFARAFVLDIPDTQPHIGFEVQSPMGPGCPVEFTDVVFEQRSLDQLRNGS
ncbi:DUF1349 domain-containing protein [Populibacterium corticicola]|uniref:DUF1349 domain-containing protein n=1 Tax=Populibacterium corticicola TaxID=1812826 RepID=A0ABW5XF47_9MICO